MHARHERESNQERILVESIYDSERAFMSLRDSDPERATDILSLCNHLKATGQLTDRDLVLAAHAREKVALPKTERDLREGHEDRVIALALVGRELDDRYRDQMKNEKEKLLGELEAMPARKREEVFADFESFSERDAAEDSNFCRREMHRALREEREELHRAYVYALALEKKQARFEVSLPMILAEDDVEDGGRR